jgi:hypothetical protein
MNIGFWAVIKKIADNGGGFQTMLTEGFSGAEI